MALTTTATARRTYSDSDCSSRTHRSERCPLAAVFRSSRSLESTLIGDHRRAERRRLALLECLALRVEIGEVQREAGELVDSDTPTVTISPVSR
jgi:hypothetical protein